MVLIVAGEKQHYDDHTHLLGKILTSNPHLKQISSEFRDIQKSSIEKDDGLLYVHQGEMAIVSFDTCPKNTTIPSYLASDDATSCYIVILRCTKGCAIVHLDMELRVNSFVRQIISFLNGETRIKVYIVGGFQDSHNIHERVLELFLRFLLFSQQFVFDLVVFCVGGLNILSFPSTLIKYPAIMGVIYDNALDVLKPASISWKARGPLASLRLSRLHSGSHEVMNVFDRYRCCLVVYPFSYAMNYSNPEITKEELRSQSTTPDQEPQSYFEGMLAVHRLMHHYPNPLQSWFSDGLLMFRCIQSSTPLCLWIPPREQRSIAEHPLMNVVSKSED